MDGAYAEVNRFSIGRAVVSAGTGLPSGELEGTVGDVPIIMRSTVAPTGMKPDRG
jgi:hypothetical protein